MLATLAGAKAGSPTAESKAVQHAWRDSANGGASTAIDSKSPTSSVYGMLSTCRKSQYKRGITRKAGRYQYRSSGRRAAESRIGERVQLPKVFPRLGSSASCSFLIA